MVQRIIRSVTTISGSKRAHRQLHVAAWYGGGWGGQGGWKRLVSLSQSALARIVGVVSRSSVVTLAPAPAPVRTRCSIVLFLWEGNLISTTIEHPMLVIEYSSSVISIWVLLIPEHEEDRVHLISLSYTAWR
ncbi:hypothetical protein J6590_031115 [Homalodisca vitripennis]|nr:hypothetical protein J6590_031115 [Homalodisca vitripennis]